MKPKLWLALCTPLAALAAALPGAHAGQSSPKPDPADPGVAVPAPAYVSAMKDYLPAVKDGGPTPDRAWRTANEALGGQHAHAGHGTAAPAPAPAQPAPQRVEPAPAPGHQHQHQHH